ncbi:AraC family transcriptional regulator [Bacillus carboniphilus]|uniref:AraC family transcriptional regulator n=1 Tax=Bacillus carboniphilus TaxID=86663 RepID=A0ABY9JR10_9BACI|nr:AraC family transcriptional regulator [Bacillus carboniphilus]WLR41839.1 AraC family transcriptional regulator [Bacillus carboniphilus]
MNQIVCEKRSYSREFHSHQHDYGQILFPLQGTLEMKTDWQEIRLSTEYCFYLPPSFQHVFRSVDRNEFLILDIANHYLPEKAASVYIQLDQKWTSIRYLLLEEARNHQVSSSLTDLTRYVSHQLQKSISPSIDYIHKHYKQPISIEKLASIEHYHPVYYSTWFKEKMGKSPKVYISDLRLKEAKNLLLATTWSMSNISEELGFENASSFTRWFVKCEGIPPQTYRDLNIR